MRLQTLWERKGQKNGTRTEMIRSPVLDVVLLEPPVAQNNQIWFNPTAMCDKHIRGTEIQSK